MKNLSLLIFGIIATCALMSFSSMPPSELRLDLDPRNIQWTPDGDIVEEIIYTHELSYDAETEGYDRVAEVGIEFCPGIGERCGVVYIDGGGTVVVLSAKKTVGGPSVVITVD